MKYSKEQAIKVAIEFIAEVNKLEEKYKMTFNSDTGDVYFSYKSNEIGKNWDSVSLGWVGDGSGIKVMQERKNDLKQQALAKLTPEERTALGL